MVGAGASCTPVTSTARSAVSPTATLPGSRCALTEICAATAGPPRASRRAAAAHLTGARASRAGRISPILRWFGDHRTLQLLHHLVRTDLFVALRIEQRRRFLA